MRDRSLECWLHRCSRRREREASAASARSDHFSRENSVSSSSHIPVTGKPAAMYSHKRQSSRDPASLQESYSAREGTFAEHRENKAAEGEEATLLTLSDAENHTRLLLEERRNQILSEARSRMKMQEFFLEKKKESADMALRESNRQIHSHRMELYQANQVYENSQREQIMFHAELENRERTLQETRIGTLQEMEGSKKICCTEPWGTQRLRMDELARQKKQQESQSKVNSLNESRDFHDAETASSSGLHHVHSHPLIVPSSFGVPCRDLCPKPDSQNLFGTPGNVFENPPAPDEPTASCSRNVYARSLTATRRTCVSKHRQIYREN